VNEVFVLLYLLRMMPLAGAADFDHRVALARAIVAVTDDAQEQRQLARIARFESSLRADVADCRVRGAAGEVSAWQVLARGADERRALCVSLEDDARIALGRVRESRSACRRLPVEEQLAVFTRGNCASVEGRRLARTRYTP
jgi:hypothetical protein